MRGLLAHSTAFTMASIGREIFESTLNGPSTIVICIIAAPSVTLEARAQHGNTITSDKIFARDRSFSMAM